MADIRQTGSQSWRDLQKENNSTFNPETATPQDWYRQLKKRDYNSYASQPTEYVGIKAAQAGFGNSQYDEGLVSTSQLNDLNDIRYQNQPWYDTLANGVVKMLGTAGTTFLSSLVGLPTGIGTAIGEGRWSGLWDNAVTDALSGADEWLEENFKNYKSTEQENAPWYSLSNLGSMSFWADDVIKNMGFTLGAAASMAVGSGSLGLISRAFGAVNQASKGAGMAGKFASALFSATGEGMIEARNGVEERNKLETQRLNDALAPERQALEEEFNLINEEYNATKGQTLIKGADGKAYDPAYLRYSQRMQELSKKRNDLNQRYNDGLRQIEESGREMGNKILLGNQVLLTAGNLIQFGKLMNKSFDNARHAAEITSKSTKPFGVAIERAGNSIKDGYKVTGKNFGRTVAATKGILTEGSEEMNQQWIQSSAGVSSNEIDANDYWRAKMSPDSYRETTKDLYSLGNTISQGFKDSWGDVNQWEQFVIGGLTGMAGSYAPTKIFNQDQTKSRLNPLRYGSWEGGAYNEIRDFNKQYRQQEENVEDLNKILAQENFGERTRNLIAHTYLENQKEDAALAGDMKRWKDEDDKQAIHDIQAFLRAGKIDDLRAIYEEMGKDMSDEDIQGIIKATTQEISADRDKQNHDDAIDAKIADHRAKIEELNAQANKIAEDAGMLETGEEVSAYNNSVQPAVEKLYEDVDKEYAAIDELEQQKQNYAGQTRYVSPYLNEDGSQRKSNDEIREEIKHNSDEMNRKLNSYLDSVEEVNRRTGGNLTKDQEDNLAYLHNMGKTSINRADRIVEDIRKDLPNKFLFKTDKTPEQLAKEYASSDLAFTKDDDTPEGYVSVDTSMLAGHNFTDFLIRDIIWGRNQRPEFGETADERAAREEEEKNLDDEEKKKRRTAKWKKQYDEAKKNAEKQRRTNLGLIIDTFESNYKKNNRATEAETDIATGKFIGNIVDALGLMKQGGAFEKTLTEYMRNPQKVDQDKAKEEKKAEKQAKKDEVKGMSVRDLSNRDDLNELFSEAQKENDITLMNKIKKAQVLREKKANLDAADGESNLNGADVSDEENAALEILRQQVENDIDDDSTIDDKKEQTAKELTDLVADVDEGLIDEYVDAHAVVNIDPKTGAKTLSLKRGALSPEERSQQAQFEAENPEEYDSQKTILIDRIHNSVRSIDDRMNETLSKIDDTDIVSEDVAKMQKYTDQIKKDENLPDIEPEKKNDRNNPVQTVPNTPETPIERRPVDGIGEEAALTSDMRQGTENGLQISSNSGQHPWQIVSGRVGYHTNEPYSNTLRKLVEDPNVSEENKKIYRKQLKRAEAVEKFLSNEESGAYTRVENGGAQRRGTVKFKVFRKVNEAAEDFVIFICSVNDKGEITGVLGDLPSSDPDIDPNTEKRTGLAALYEEARKQYEAAVPQQSAEQRKVIKPSYHESMKKQLGDKLSKWRYYTDDESNTNDLTNNILGRVFHFILVPAINYAVDAGVIGEEYRILNPDDAKPTAENSEKIRQATRALAKLKIRTPQQLIEYVEQHEGEVQETAMEPEGEPSGTVAEKEVEVEIKGIESEIDFEYIGKPQYRKEGEPRKTVNELFNNGEFTLALKVSDNNEDNPVVKVDTGKKSLKGKLEMDAIKDPLTGNVGQPYILIPTSQAARKNNTGRGYWAVPIATPAFGEINKSSVFYRTVKQTLESIRDGKLSETEAKTRLGELFGIANFHVNFTEGESKKAPGIRATTYIRQDGSEKGAPHTLYVGDRASMDVETVLNELGRFFINISNSKINSKETYTTVDGTSYTYNQMIGEIATTDAARPHTVNDWFTIRPVEKKGNKWVKSETPTQRIPYPSGSEKAVFHVTIPYQDGTKHVWTISPRDWTVRDEQGRPIMYKDGIHSEEEANVAAIQMARAFGRYYMKDMSKPYVVLVGEQSRLFDPTNNTFKAAQELEEAPKYKKGQSFSNAEAEYDFLTTIEQARAEKAAGGGTSNVEITAQQIGQDIANVSPEVEEQLLLVFERIPELNKIGSIREYAAYLADIFPNSVDKSIYWHGTNEDMSEGFKSAKKGRGSGAPETQLRNDFYLAKQAWSVLQYVNGVNRNSIDKNGFAHWNKLWWELKEIMSNGRRENNNWKDMVIGEETVRQGIPNKKGVFNRDKGGENGKWLSERKADYGYENKSDKEFFEDILGIQWGKDTFNTWTKRNAEAFKALEKTQKGIYPAIINTQNPIREKGQNTYYEEQRGLFTQADREGNDAILGEHTDNEFGSDVAVVLNASEENVHFLGTKDDIEGFKNWLKKNRASKVVDESTKDREEAQKALNRERTEATIKKIKEDSADFVLADGNGNEDPNGDYYKNKKTGELHARVTSVKEGDTRVLPFKETDEQGNRNPWITPSTTIGNAVDEFVRLFFEGQDPESSVLTQNLSDKTKQHLREELEKIQKSLGTKWKVAASGIKAVGNITVKDANGDDMVIRVAGTLDLLLYNPEKNEYAIYDMKTHRGGVEDKKLGWAAQLSLYKQLLEARYPEMRGKIKGLKIVPFTTSGYDANKQSYDTDDSGRLTSNGEIVKAEVKYDGSTIDMTKDEMNLNISFARPGFKKEYVSGVGASKIIVSKPQPKLEEAPKERVKEGFVKSINKIANNDSVKTFLKPKFRDNKEAITLSEKLDKARKDGNLGELCLTLGEMNLLQDMLNTRMIDRVAARSEMINRGLDVPAAETPEADVAEGSQDIDAIAEEKGILSTATRKAWNKLTDENKEKIVQLRRGVKDVKKELKECQRLGKDPNSAIAGYLHRKADETSGYTIIDMKKELAWLDKVLPKLSKESRIRIIEGLIKCSDGTFDYGQIKQGLVYIATNGKEGTVYHEAFHAVTQWILTDNELDRLYKAAKERYGNLDTVVLEEKLADDFMRYTMGFEPSYKKHDLNIFQKLWQAIKNMFKHTSMIDKLYRDINDGIYADSVLRTNNNEFAHITEEDRQVSMKYQFLDKEQQQRLKDEKISQEQYEVLDADEKRYLFHCVI